MGINGGKTPSRLIAYRRQVVASLVVKQYKLREIREALAKDPDMLNAAGEPPSMSTIHRDTQAVQKEWQDAAADSINNHIAKTNVQINQVIHEAWKQDNLSLVLKAIQLRMKLLGLEAPERQSLEVTATTTLSVEEYKEIAKQQVEEITNPLIELDAIDKKNQGQLN